MREKILSLGLWTSTYHSIIVFKRFIAREFPISILTRLEKSQQYHLSEAYPLRDSHEFALRLNELEFQDAFRDGFFSFDNITHAIELGEDTIILNGVDTFISDIKPFVTTLYPNDSSHFLPIQVVVQSRNLTRDPMKKIPRIHL